MNMDSSGDKHHEAVKARPTVSKKKKRKQKPHDFPKRPLSAYNIFFREARASIVASEREKEGEGAKIDFQSLARDIASQWKILPGEERERVEELAKQDLKRYRQEVQEYEEKMVQKNRQQREQTAANLLQEEMNRQPTRLPDEQSAWATSGVTRAQDQTAISGGTLSSDFLPSNLCAPNIHPSTIREREQMQRLLAQDLMETEAKMEHLRQRQRSELQSRASTTEAMSSTQAASSLSLRAAGMQAELDHLVLTRGLDIPPVSAPALPYSGLGIGDSPYGAGLPLGQPYLGLPQQFQGAGFLHSHAAAGLPVDFIRSMQERERLSSQIQAQLTREQLEADYQPSSPASNNADFPFARQHH
jgi:hypothetical protein